jgi:hypothetical protein
MQIDFSILPQTEEAPLITPMFNVGCLFDIATGRFIRGIHGEHILSGGAGAVTGFVGIANTYKTTCAEYMQLTIGARFPYAIMDKHCTELSAQVERSRHLASQIPEYLGEDPTSYGTSRWKLTNQAQYWGNEWFKDKRIWLSAKADNRMKFSFTSPFPGKDEKPMKMMYPTSSLVDSLTRFETESVSEMDEKAELGDSAANTLYMKAGQAKARMVGALPRLSVDAGHLFFLTAHVGKLIGMDPYAGPTRKLTTLKNGDVIKGVTDNFLFLTTQCWQTYNAGPLINQTTKAPEYPRNTDDNVSGDTDLVLLTLNLLRNKSGPSGLMMNIIVSQEDGLQPSLSEFHYCKINDRWGLGGNDKNYYLELMPEEKLSRTTVRGKLDKNAALRRAMNITSEMLQMKMLWDNIPAGYMCTPLELYTDLKAKGYDWGKILNNTRGWWTAEQDDHPLKFLSTMDLLAMRAGVYQPYWDPQDKLLKV